MPVTSTHRQYDGFRKKWKRCRDAAEGSDAVKDAGTEYLPKLTSQERDEYEAYKTRALWYGATGRTIQGLAGGCFRKAPRAELPAAFGDWERDITLTGVPLEVFARDVMDEVLTVGRVGVYAEMPPERERGQDAPANGARRPRRPYLVMVKAENILNWMVTYEDGRQVLTRVVIREDKELPGADAFQVKHEDRWREMALEDGRYVQRVWKKVERDVTRTTVGQAQDEYVVEETIVPTRRLKPLDFIPFAFVGPANLTPDVEKPPLLDLVDVNLSHYRSSADLEHGRHYCGLPTPWVAGFPKETKLRVGSNIAWVAEDASAKAGILEFTGQGLGALENALEAKERLLAVLGARLLEQQKRAAEAAETVWLRQSGEQVTLLSIIATVELGVLQALRWAVYWAGGDEEKVTFELNKDVVAVQAQPQQLVALLQVVQGGLMTFETAYYNLEQLEMTRPGVTAEEELKGIRNQEEQALRNRPPSGAGEAVSPDEEAEIEAELKRIEAEAA